MGSALASDDAQAADQVLDGERLVEKGDGVQTTTEVVPSVPPRSPDRVGPLDRQI